MSAVDELLGVYLAHKRISDAAIALVVWEEQLPIPEGWYEELERRREALFGLVRDTFTDDEWWDLTYHPEPRP